MKSIAQQRLKFLENVYRLQSLEELSQTLITELPTVIGGDNVMIGRHNGLERKLTGLILRHPFSYQHFLPESNENGLIGLHPFWDRLLDETEPLKILSVMRGAQQWRKNPFYSEVLRPDRVLDHINIEFGDGIEDFTSVGVLRSRVGFCERDRETMRMLQPHLRQAFANARLYDQHRTDRSAVGPGKMLEIDPRGQCACADLRALLAKWVGRRIDVVWPVFVAWLSGEVDAYNRGILRSTSDGWCIQAGNNTLRFVIRREALSMRYWLFYWIEETGSLSARPTRLTPKEQCILALLADGKKNAEIAVLLHISLQTVKTHLKHLFCKLGVDNRTAAARFAHQAKMPESFPHESGN